MTKFGLHSITGIFALKSTGHRIAYNWVGVVEEQSSAHTHTPGEKWPKLTWISDLSVGSIPCVAF